MSDISIETQRHIEAVNNLWKPRYTVGRIDHDNDGTLTIVPGPNLVILAQDELAGEMINHYLDRYQETIRTSSALALHRYLPVYQELLIHQEVLANWQATHPTKAADR